MMIGTAPARAAVTQAVDEDGFASLTSCNAATPANTTIQAGVNAAAAGDTVKVCPGTYTENVTVDKALILNGAKPGVTAPVSSIPPTNRSCTRLTPTSRSSRWRRTGSR